MNMVGRSAGLALVGGVACLLAAAIGGAPVEACHQAGQVPVFRARTDLVQLYATVRAANGDPVKGLRDEDFSVFDNDKRVKLEVVAEGPEWAREHSVNGGPLVHAGTARPAR